MRYVYKKIMWKEFMAGVLFATLILLPWSSLLGSEPYMDVEITEVERTDGGYVVHANFIKTDCTFKRLEVFGSNTGVLVYLDWSALDGSPATDYDRSTGKQHMIILVNTTDVDYDTLEIRTRHACDGVAVDKVFATIDLESGLHG
jgi:hypothetical protein